MGYSLKIFAAAIALVAATDLGWSADLSLPAAAPAAYNWTGLYIGLNAGFMDPKVTDSLSGGATGTGSANVPGGMVGGQIGYNYQIGTMVLGFEADFDGSMATKSFTVGTIASGTDQIPWVGTVRGRAGLAFDRTLLYVTAGGAATQLVSTVNVPAIASASTSFTHGAWTAGGGVEYAITDAVSARLEYLYFDTGDFNVAYVGANPPPPSAAVTGRIQDNMVRVGLNYRLPIVP